MKQFADKVALITGGASGIGAAIARELIEMGMRVAVADIDYPRARKTAGELGVRFAHALALDVTNPVEWCRARTAIEALWGPVDVLCSNAGVSFPGKLDELEPAAWRWVYEVNVMGSFNGVRSLLPGMKARNTDGHILLTCSITSLLPMAGQAAYTSNKAALLNLAGALRKELSSTRIGVSALCPGLAATDIATHAANARPESLKLASPQRNSISSAGMAPEAIAKAAIAAIREDRFYVFTHREYRQGVRDAQDTIFHAMASSADPSHRDPPMTLEALLGDN